jgi:hypothetical protein
VKALKARLITFMTRAFSAELFSSENPGALSKLT